MRQPFIWRVADVLVDWFIGPVLLLSAVVLCGLLVLKALAFLLGGWLA